MRPRITFSDKPSLQKVGGLQSLPYLEDAIDIDECHLYKNLRYSDADDGEHTIFFSKKKDGSLWTFAIQKGIFWGHF